MLRAAAESSDPKVKPFEDLANLSLARTFYSTGQFDLAVKYFDRVSQESYDWANSLFEASWANFMLKQKGYSKALGNIHTLQAPFFENYIKPESVAEALTVKATIYFYNCLFDRAEEAINEFNAVYPNLVGDLKKLISRDAPTTRRCSSIAVKIRSGTSGLPEQTERAARGVLGDISLVKRFQYVEELDRELEQHDKAEAGWKSTNIAQAVFADLTLQRSLAVNEAGDLARRRIIRLTRELAQLIKRVIKIEYEIIQGESGNVEEEIGRSSRSSGPAASGRAEEIRVDDEHIVWPFTGEYWRDELGYYRVKVANKCAEERARRGAGDRRDAAGRGRRRGAVARRRGRGAASGAVV